MKAKKTIEQSRSSVKPQDLQKNSLLRSAPEKDSLMDLISTIAKAEGDKTPSRLEKVMVEASKPMKYTLSGSTDGQEQAFAVQNYAKFETDPQKREKFAAKQLNKYIESLEVTNLNDKEKEKISKALTAIMTPICNDKQKTNLKNSVDKLIKECAEHAGEKMSFKQAWRDYIVEPIKQFLGIENRIENEKENVLKSFEKESVAIGKSIKKKIDTSAAQKPTPKKPPKSESRFR